MSGLVGWPEKPEFIGEDRNDRDVYSVGGKELYIDDALIAYERARAEAALSRLRVAVTALKQISVGAPIVPTKRWLDYDEIGDVADKALIAIGEVPD